jgi:hypothetical protein
MHHAPGREGCNREAAASVIRLTGYGRAPAAKPGARTGLPAALTAATTTAAVAATAAATTAVAATTTRAAAATGTATAATRAGTILRFIDAQGTATHVEAVERLHGALGVSLGHFYEAEAARAAGFAVCREGNGFDGAVLCEELAHIRFRRGERQVAHVNLGHSNILRSNTIKPEPSVIARPALLNSQPNRDSPPSVNRAKVPVT